MIEKVTPTRKCFGSKKSPNFPGLGLKKIFRCTKMIFGGFLPFYSSKLEKNEVKLSPVLAQMAHNFKGKNGQNSLLGIRKKSPNFGVEKFVKFPEFSGSGKFGVPTLA